MLITPSTLQNLQTSFSARYRAGYDQAAPFAEKIATIVPSSTSINTYGWMKKLPIMRQWLGPRVINNMAAHSYTLENEDWELTVGVGRNEIEDDQLGLYAPMMEDMGRAARKWPDQLLKTVLQAGTSNLGFDGVAFFASTHPLDPAGNQSNNFTSSALTPANYATVREAMQGYKGEDGQPLGVMPNLLIVPPQLEREARQILMADLIPNGAGTASESNVLKGSADLLVVPELANQATTWYMADVSKSIKGLIFQSRKAPEFVSKASPSDDGVFYDKQFVYGVDARGAAGYGPWFLLARSIA